jgi:hypothetical protein
MNSILINLKRMDIVNVPIFLFPRTWIFWFWFVLFFLTALRSSYSRHPEIGVGNWINSLISTLCVMAIISVIQMIYLCATASKKSGTLGEHEFQIRNDGLYEKTPVNETLHKWISVSGVYRTRWMILIRIGNAATHLIPKRSFRSSEDYDLFFRNLLIARKEGPA